MVYLIHESDCICATCDGGKPAPPGHFGGSHCICRCHKDPEFKAQRIKEQQEKIGSGIRAMLDHFVDSCGPLAPITVGWSARGIGFGSFYFYPKDGKLHCDNECMSKEFIKRMLCLMVDQCELDDPMPPAGTKDDKEGSAKAD
jgi:hypothetical protein